MRKIMLTRVTCQSYQKNKKGYHVLSETGRKIHSVSWTGLMYLSSNIVDEPFFVMEVDEKFHDRLIGIYDPKPSVTPSLGGIANYENSVQRRNRVKKEAFAELKKIVLNRFINK